MHHLARRNRRSGNFMSATLVPPSPKGHFLLGNIGELRQDTLAFFTRTARELGDVASFRAGLRRIVLVSQPRLIEEILVTNAKSFTKHLGARMLRSTLGNGLLTSEGPFWLRQRRLIQPSFSRERIATYAPVMVDLADRASATWKDGQTRDVHADMTRLTLEIIARSMFGADVSEQAVVVGEAVADLAAAMVRRYQTVLRLPPLLPTPANIRRWRSGRQIDSILYDIIRKRRDSKIGGDDLLGILIRVADADDGSRMTDQQLRDEAITLFLAGHDTTALTLTWGLYLLARHPDVAGALEKELDEVLAGRVPNAADIPRLRYTEMVIREILRLYPSAYVVGRAPVKAYEVGGYTVQPGGTILMSQWVVHRDPRWYDKPEQFRPERWADTSNPNRPKFSYFPFGGGPRICVGNHFAMMEAVLVLATVARNWRVSVPEGELPVAPKPQITLRPSRPVRLTLQRR
jgi:cytochrome P450